MGIETAIIIGGIAAAAGSVGSAAIGAHAAGKSGERQTDAANHAADVEAASNADALAFARSQAQNEFANSEAARHGNYDQWAAREQRLSALGAMVGLGPRDIPAYVPGVDPQYVDGGRVSGAAPASGGGTGTTTDARALEQLLNSGLTPAAAAQKFNAQYKRVTGNEAVFYPENGTVSIPEGYFSTGAQGWKFAPRAAQASGGRLAAPAGAGAPYVGSVGDLVGGGAATRRAVLTPGLERPGPYRSGSIADLV